MIVDTSALIALLKEEKDAPRIADAIDRHSGRIAMSAASYLEASIIADRCGDAELAFNLDIMIADARIEIVPVTYDQARLARQAHRAFGRGSGHPAKLNFGDCFV